jgi:disulfide bond formation protein DsbB
MPTTRRSLLALSAISFALVGVALYLQHARDMLPCPLCVIQRYLFLAVGIASLAGAFSSRAKAWTLLALASALGGLGVAGKHLYVLAHPGFSCGIDPMETILNKIPTATLLPWLFRADGLCEAAQDTVFGLNVPQWSAVWFALLSAALVALLVRSMRAAHPARSAAH